MALFFWRKMPLTRTDHWATREFHDFLMSRHKMPFAWGTNDCCMFVADAIKSFTGVDIADDFRDRYTDAASAFQTIKSVTGGTTVADAAAHCASKHGLQELSSPLLAQRGDLVLVQEGSELIAGIVHLSGRHIAVVGEEGLKRKPITEAKRAWRV